MGLNAEWTAERLAEEMSSRPHNPRIAYALFRADMIGVWGRGIRWIADICREAGNPAPTWRLEAGGDGLWVRFPFSEAYRAADSAVRGHAAGNAFPDTTQKSGTTTQKTTPKSGGTTRKSARDRILDCLRADPRLTRTALAERIGLSPDGVKYHLQNLNASGVIRRVGSDRAGHWEVLA